MWPHQIPCHLHNFTIFITNSNSNNLTSPFYDLTSSNIATLCLAVVVQSLSHVWLSATSRTAARQAPLSFTGSWSLLRFMSIESVMLSNHLILCCPFCLHSFPASRSFPMSWLFLPSGQSIGASASASVLLIIIKGWLPKGWTGLVFAYQDHIDPLAPLNFPIVK